MVYKICCLLALVAVVSAQRRPAYQYPPPLPSTYESLAHARESLALRDFSRYKPVNVTIFFESMCPDSRNFIIRQVYPMVFNKVIPNELYNLHFIPFGNAYTSYEPTTKTYTFNCQHGSSECTGNIYKICYDLIVQNVTESITFYKCMFEEIFNGAPISEAAFYCTESLKNVQPLYDAWLACNSTMGPALHAHMGDRTRALVPSHTFIPWATFDSNGSNGINNEALSNLADVIMKYWLHKNNDELQKK